MKENRAMTNKDLNEVLIAEEPPDPIWISLDPKTKAEDTEGTERFPYASVDQAEEEVQESDDYGDYPSIQVVCATSCEKIVCAEAECKKMVCKVHGGGRGQLFAGPGSHLAAYDDEFWIQKCIDCQVVTFDDHLMTKCEVCSNGTTAELSLIGDSFPIDRFPVCDDCVTTCEKEVEGGNGELCGFACCKSYEEHACGYDPRDCC